jgi:hypothetical protein
MEDMGMQDHVRRLALMMIIYSAVSALLVLVTFVAVGAPTSLVEKISNMGFGQDSAFPVFPQVIVGLLFINLALALPTIAVGFGIMRFSSAARMAAIVVLTLQCVNIPFGPVMSAYGFWVLLSLETEPLFDGSMQRIE